MSLLAINGPDELEQPQPVQADGAGNFSYSFTLGSATGDYSIQALTPDGAISLAMTSFSSGVYVVSDKNDYAPGETATFSGRGFDALETVNLVVRQTYPGGAEERHFSSVADENGAFTQQRPRPRRRRPEHHAVGHRDRRVLGPFRADRVLGRDVHA